ncbi:phage tail protein [Sphingomonas sp. CJ20]
MSAPYIGEIRILPYPRGAPVGWLICDGGLKSISEYEPLFTLLGTTYGGNGVSTFGVPDLRSAVPIHNGHGTGLSNYGLGQKGGAEGVTLIAAQMPSHNHNVAASTAAATSNLPTNNILAGGTTVDPFYATNVPAATPQPLSSTMVRNSGGSQPHENCAPTLAVQYCIAYSGIFPSRS